MPIPNGRRLFACFSVHTCSGYCQLISLPLTYKICFLPIAFFSLVQFSTVQLRQSSVDRKLECALIINWPYHHQLYSFLFCLLFIRQTLFCFVYLSASLVKRHFHVGCFASDVNIFTRSRAQSMSILFTFFILSTRICISSVRKRDKETKMSSV